MVDKNDPSKKELFVVLIKGLFYSFDSLIHLIKLLTFSFGGT